MTSKSEYRAISCCGAVIVSTTPCHSTSYCACPRMNITWHSLAQRVLGVMKCGISHKTSLPRPGLTFRDVVQTGEERHQKYNTLNTDKLASRLRKERPQQERCLPSFADAVHVSVREVASHGTLLAGQDGGEQPQQRLCDVPGDLKVEVRQKRSQLVQKFCDREEFRTSSAHSHCCVPGVSVVLRQAPN